jgi:mono/diheme cytochrome c family protein
MTRSHLLPVLVAVSAFALTACSKEKAPPTQPSEAPSAKAPAPTAPAQPQDRKKLAAEGANLYTSQGCVTCHSTDGSMRIGPSFAGLYGRKEELTDGTTVTVDDAYIRQSILDPNSQVAKGFVPTMTPYKGRISDEEIQALTEWIKTLK